MFCKFIVLVTLTLSICSAIYGQSVPLTGTATNKLITINNITQNTGNVTIEEALEYSKVTIEIIEDFINDDLVAEAKSEGYEILQNVRDGLSFCESELKTVEDIWSYKICTNALLRSGLAALAELQSLYNSKPSTTSGAGKMKLFWSIDECGDQVCKRARSACNSMKPKLL